MAVMNSTFLLPRFVSARLARWGALLALLLSPAAAPAGIFDFLKPASPPGGSSNSASPLSLAGLSEEQLTKGLKEALAKGVGQAVTNLSRPGGFLTNLNVRIPMPEKLATVERALRAVKQDHIADEFVATMNHAAEAAVPEAGAIFTDAIKGLNVADAQTLLKGSDDAVTQYFKKTGETRIQEKMLPVVKQATEKANVTASYKQLMAKAGPAASLFNLGGTDLDLDRYVTQKASDGLFKMIAEEEKRIRQNPAARTTELLQKVFGAK
jgi:hypothetical protein